jgi:hypothetical protein
VQQQAQQQAQAQTQAQVQQQAQAQIQPAMMMERQREIEVERARAERGDLLASSRGSVLPVSTPVAVGWVAALLSFGLGLAYLPRGKAKAPASASVGLKRYPPARRPARARGRPRRRA